MSIQNLWEMAKADRYTADGCDQIKKAQEQLAEDERYEIGQISKKTGLLKTANGWVKPKNENQSGVKKEDKKINYQVTEKGGKFYATGHQFSDGSQLYAGPFGSEEEVNEFMNNTSYKPAAERNAPGTKADEGKSPAEAKPDSKVENKHPPRVMPKGMKPEEFMKMWEDDAKKHGFNEGQGEEWREYLRKEEGYKPIEKPKENKSAKKKTQFDEWEEEVRQNKASLDKQAAKVTKVLSTPADKALYKDIYSFADDEHTDFKSALYTIAEGVAEDAKEKGRDKAKDAAIIKMARALGVANDLESYISDEHEYKFASDSAPRQLTGDSKIRIRKA